MSKKPELPAPKAECPARKASTGKIRAKTQTKTVSGPLRIIGDATGSSDAVRKTGQINKRIKMDFETLLNKQFVEKVNRYEFLDPFAGEFRYSNGKVSFSGH
ncbi:MAG: hypothetical protein R2874_10855 [Desulfobacterales bacterium]